MPTPSPLPRVLFVIGSLEPGGSESQLVTLLEQGHGRRFDAALVTLVAADDERLTRRVGALGVPHRVLRRAGQGRVRGLARSVRGLAATIRAARPDVVYPWLEESALLAAPIARALGAPVVVARRNVAGGYSSRPAPVIAAIHRAERLAAIATANSEAVAAETVRRGIPPERVRIVPNGQPLPEPSPPPAAPPIVLGYVARMRAEKGHRRLLDALARLEARAPWRVDLAGDGPERPAVEAEIARRGLGDRVRLLGAVDDVGAFWRDRHVAVLLSDHEGSPNALIEGALHARPLVATAVGGMRELVGADLGLLVDPDDPAAIAAALARMIDDAELRERLGAGARRVAAERFSLERFLDGHAAAIAAALGHG